METKGKQTNENLSNEKKSCKQGTSVVVGKKFAFLCQLVVVVVVVVIIVLVYGTTTSSK